MPGYWKLNTFAGCTKQHPETFPDPGQPSLAYEVGFLLGIPDRLLRVDQHLRLPAADRRRSAASMCATPSTSRIRAIHMATARRLHTCQPGEYHMDGATALAYARSRHGSSDFARAKRQQQLLTRDRARRSFSRRTSRACRTSSRRWATSCTPTSRLTRSGSGLLSVANQVDANPTAQYVFDFPDWAQHLPRTETNGRSVQFLKMDQIAALSQQIFGGRVSTGRDSQYQPWQYPPTVPFRNTGPRWYTVLNADPRRRGAPEL